MKQRKSEIFEAYAQTLKNAGLLSGKIEKEASANPRYDSLSFSDIEALYGVKPEGYLKGKDIVEEAHPETVVYPPSYDAMNAVFENVNQRQRVMVDIALKMPDGQLVGRRYVKATNDLMNETVKLGYLLESEDAELMNLADSISGRLHKKALGPLAAGGIALAAVGALFGLYLFYGSTSVQSVVANGELLLGALDIATAEAPYYDPIYKDVSELVAIAKQYREAKKAGLSAELSSLDDVVLKAQDPAVSVMNQSQEAYLKKLKSVAKKIPSWNAAVDSQIKGEGLGGYDFTTKFDWIRSVVPVGYRAYLGSESSAENVKDKLQAFGQAVSQAQADITAAASKARALKPKVDKIVREGPKPKFLENEQ